MVKMDEDIAKERLLNSWIAIETQFEDLVYSQNMIATKKSHFTFFDQNNKN